MLAESNLRNLRKCYLRITLDLCDMLAEWSVFLKNKKDCFLESFEVSCV